MTDEQIRVWTRALEKRIHILWEHEPMDGMIIEDAARTLIASVRAEAIEECAKALEDAPLTYAGPDPSLVRHLRYLMIAAIRDRALVKERKGEE